MIYHNIDMHVSRIKRDRYIKKREKFSSIESVIRHRGIPTNLRLVSIRSDEKCWKICKQAPLCFYIYELGIVNVIGTK